jgi:hypothetical protein
VRNTFARFIDTPHSAGPWWQLEFNVDARQHLGHNIGYALECCIFAFHNGQPAPVLKIPELHLRVHLHPVQAQHPLKTLLQLHFGNNKMAKQKSNHQQSMKTSKLRHWDQLNNLTGVRMT